jgi:hypothetical protein
MSADGGMSGASAVAEPPSASAVDGPPLHDRSMQVLEYLVATIAVAVAVVLTFLR